MAAWIALLMTVTVAPAFAAGTPDYKRLNPACSSCVEISNILDKYATQNDSDERMNSTLGVSAVIHRMSLAQADVKEQRRAIYYALHGTIEVLDDDFDSQSIVELLNLRPQAPKAFDYVFHRLSLNEQKEIYERMVGVKRTLSPKAQLPTVKAIAE